MRETSRQELLKKLGPIENYQPTLSSKREYVEALLPQIKQWRARGLTLREIAAILQQRVGLLTGARELSVYIQRAEKRRQRGISLAGDLRQPAPAEPSRDRARDEVRPQPARERTGSEPTSGRPSVYDKLEAISRREKLLYNPKPDIKDFL